MGTVKLCPTCGAQNSINHMFCSSCHIPLADVAPVDEEELAASARRATAAAHSNSAETSFLSLEWPWGIEPVTNGMIIGRAPAAPLFARLGSKLFISREHAQIRIENLAVMLIDLNSTNGTSIDGERLTPKQLNELRPGMTICFGCDDVPPGESVSATVRLADGD